MGKLLSISEVAPNATWYFDDAYITYSNGRNKYKWPNPSYSHPVCIHFDELYHNNKLKIEIRKFVEDNLTETVIYDTVEMDYYKFFSDDHSWDRKWDISNSWFRFNFESKDSAIIFVLKFSEFVKPMTAWHPDHPEDEEWLKLPMEERRYT